MRLSVQTQHAVKIICYALLSLAALCFSAAFFPALGVSESVPRITVAIISALAMKEGIKYASFFAVIFGGIEAYVFGESPLVYVLFYGGFAFLCMALFGSFFTKNFFSWGLYTLGGILLFAVLQLFRPVSEWGVSAANVIAGGTLQSLLLSVVFSLPVYPIVAKIKAKTE